MFIKNNYRANAYLLYICKRYVNYNNNNAKKLKKNN